MADEAYLLSLAVGASDDLAAVRDGVDALGVSVSDLLARLDEPRELSLPSDGVGRSVGSIEGAPGVSVSDLMALQAAQCVTGFFVLLALLLSLGVQLWSAFSDQWRL
ncbi:MAG: hypothetical protein HFJ75_03955 [Eggerthellaceae bacterium]|nr:hypothetical protein [Eggerthellaceae bacterium]